MKTYQQTAYQSVNGQLSVVDQEYSKKYTTSCDYSRVTLDTILVNQANHKTQLKESCLNSYMYWSKIQFSCDWLVQNIITNQNSLWSTIGHDLKMSFSNHMLITVCETRNEHWNGFASMKNSLTWNGNE